MKALSQKKTDHEIKVISVFFGIAIGLCSGIGCARSPEAMKDLQFEDEIEEPIASETRRLESAIQPKKRVVVFDFWNDTPIQEATFGVLAADELRRSLATSGRVVIPDGVPSRFTTADFMQGEQVRTAQLIREARQLGVAVAVIGRVSKALFRQRGDEVGLFRQKESRAAADVEVKVFDVTSGKEIAAIARSGKSSHSTLVALDPNTASGKEARNELTHLAIRDALDSVAREVIQSVEKLSWQGSIAKIKSGKIFINAGRSSGLLVGDILKVMTPGDDVYDASSQALLGRSSGEFKGTLEVVDFIGQDGAVASVHSGANFKEGDQVYLY